MATHRELLIDWNMLDNDSNNWTLQDLQLAAELGRTLLERNEELELELKQQQAITDDQGQEIEFLSKQLNSMKEENSNRAKIYEQIESSILDLERTNSQLSRKHDVDKKRIQSLCENIEYLERKCEELNSTLQSLRNDQDKKSHHGGGGKMNRSSYFSFGSDSSEEEMNSFGMFRKRSHSLQDLRDYTPSPDEFDSGNSNSPDLKNSETEFIDSLENRIEELQNLKKKEADKVRQLETQIKLLIQENANLQQQIVQVSNDKESEISELRRHLQDSSNYNSQINASFSMHLPLRGEANTKTTQKTSCHSPQRLSVPNSHYSSSNTSTPCGSHDDTNSTDTYMNEEDSTNSFLPLSLGSSSLLNLNNNSRFPFPIICRRCSEEINILNLVSSIENDSTEDAYDWDLGNPEDEMEFSSLEHELARATGTPYRRRNNRFINQNNTSPSRRNSLNNNNNNNLLTPKKLANRSKKLREFLRTNPSQIDIEEMDYENSEILDIFFGHDDKDEVGEDVLGEHTPTRVKFTDINSNGGNDSSSGSLSTDDDDDDDDGDCASGSGSSDDRMDEDPCLIKDRKPEFNKNGKMSSGGGGSKNKMKKHKKSLSSPSSQEEFNGCGHSMVVELSSSSPKSKFLELPKRIPSDDEDDSVLEIGGKGISSAVGDNRMDQDVIDGPFLEENHEKVEEKVGSLLPYQKQESSSSGYESEYSSTSVVNRKCVSSSGGNGGSVIGQRQRQRHDPSSSEYSASDSEEITTSSMSMSSEECSSSNAFAKTKITVANTNTTTDVVDPSQTTQPEYKQILHNLFNLFYNSKRKYPIPMYPFIQEARRQSNGLIYKKP